MTLSNAHLLAMAGVGHYPWLERPETFFPQVNRFISGKWPHEAKQFLKTTF